MAKKQIRRRRRSRQEWRQIVTKFLSSDMSQREFARLNGIGKSSLERWTRLLRHEVAGEAELGPALGLIELVPERLFAAGRIVGDGCARVLVGSLVCLELPQWPSPEYVALVARAYEAASLC